MPVSELVFAAVGHLVRRRRQLGLSQSDVARMMSTTQPAIAKLESRRFIPTVVTMEKYAAAVGSTLVLYVHDHQTDDKTS